MPWMYDDSPAMERQLLQRHWRALAHWRPESWHLLLVVFAGGEPVGVQNMWADDFARCRSVGTGSWITRSRQGRGYGTEARAAVLQLAFGHLGALEAHTEYLDGNRASERVSRKLGYPLRTARRLPRRRRPRHRVPALPRPPRMGGHCAAGRHHRERPRPVRSAVRARQPGHGRSPRHAARRRMGPAMIRELTASTLILRQEAHGKR